MKYVKYILIIIILIGFNPIIYAQPNPVGYCTGGSTNGNTYNITKDVCTNFWKGTWSATDPNPPVNTGSNPVGYCTGGSTNGNTYNITKDVCTNFWKGTWSATAPPAPTPSPSPSPTPTPTPTPTNTKYQLLAPLPQLCPNGSSSTDTCTVDTAGGLSKYLNPMIKIFIGICAVLSVVMIVVGGLEYMTSELIASKEEGKKRIEEALLGLIIALGAYALLFTINPDLLNSDVNIPQVTPVTAVAPTINPFQEGTCTTSKGTYQETEAACGELNGNWTVNPAPLGDCTYSGANEFSSGVTKAKCDELGGTWEATSN